MSICVSMSVIGTPLGFEGHLFLSYVKPQSSDHLIENVIGLITQPAVSDLQGNMPIAEVVTGTRQPQEVIGPRRRNALGRGMHIDERSIGPPKTVSLDEPRSPRQQNRRLATAVEADALTTLLPKVVGECQTVPRRLPRDRLRHPLDELDHAHGVVTRSVVTRSVVTRDVVTRKVFIGDILMLKVPIRTGNNVGPLVIRWPAHTSTARRRLEPRRFSNPLRSRARSRCGSDPPCAIRAFSG